MPRLAACIAAAVVAAAAAGHGVAPAQSCPVPAYPGDAAPREAIARWMAYGAGAAGLPRELPVMGALVESGLRNLPPRETGNAGYFQMRLDIWNRGEYAGYPQRPELQLQWFVDQAAQVRQARIAAGAPDPATAESDWGPWIADVLRPAEARRDEYGLRLAEARELAGAPCAASSEASPAPEIAPPPAVAQPVPVPSADAAAPVVHLSGDRRQRALRRGAIVVTVGCPAEACATSATGTLRLAAARRALRLSAAAGRVAAGGRRVLRLRLAGPVRARVREALRSGRVPIATVRVVAVDAAGNRTVRKRTVRITG